MRHGSTQTFDVKGPIIQKQERLFKHLCRRKLTCKCVLELNCNTKKKKNSRRKIYKK